MTTEERQALREESRKWIREYEERNKERLIRKRAEKYASCTGYFPEDPNYFMTCPLEEIYSGKL